MKKIMLLLLFIPLFGFCQDFGDFKVEEYKPEPKTGLLKNQWYKSSGGSFIQYYNQTPIGIKNAISEVKSILLKNRINIEDASLNNTYLSSIVKDIYDYEMLNISIKNESSEVYQSWDIDRKSFLVINLKKDSYYIMILSLSK